MGALRRWAVVAAVLAAVTVPCAGLARATPRAESWPVTVTVQTVPPLPHVRLAFDGMPITTNAAGRASYTGMHDFDRHSLTLVDTAIDTPSRHYRFARWAGQHERVRRTVLFVEVDTCGVERQLVLDRDRPVAGR